MHTKYKQKKERKSAIEFFDIVQKKVLSKKNETKTLIVSLFFHFEIINQEKVSTNDEYSSY
jgi:hypothetical protein